MSAMPATPSRSTPFRIPCAENDEQDTRAVHADSLPEASSPALNRAYDVGRNRSVERSSSREYVNFTGTPRALEIPTASVTYAPPPRIPKPPPMYSVCRLTWFAARPLACIALVLATLGSWLPTHTSHDPALTSATDVNGSIGACAR